ncbi:MAG: tyrosine-type recombinase/integrase [Acholeplasma sp.]|nr:tyrosine-type recombinase/integrase [Acholeplasma sp.]
MAICKRGLSYSYRVYVYDHSKGKNRQIEKRGFKTKREAKIAEANFLHEYELKQSVKKHDVSFKTVYDYYFSQKSKQWKDTTRFELNLILNKRILEYFVNLDISKIDKRHINAWRDDLNQKGFSHKYKNKLLTHLKGIFQVANSEYGIVKNVMANEPSFKNDSIVTNNDSSTKIYNESEFKIFQAAVDNAMYKLFFTMLFYCGLRIGEIRALKWKDIDRVNGSLSVYKQISNKTAVKKAIEVKTKTQSSNREVYYPINEIEPLLKIHELSLSNDLDNKNDFYIFGHGIPLPETNIRRNNLKYAKKANLHSIKIHGYRHSYITLLYMKKVDVLTTKDQVGHSSIKTTLDIYTQLDKTQRHENILNAFKK